MDEVSNVLQVEFVSPEDLLFSGEATTVVARTHGGGEIAFLAGHEPFIGSLVTSQIRVHGLDQSVKTFVVRGGFVSVANSKVTVLSDAALDVATIDHSKAESQCDQAAAELAANPDDPYSLADLKWAEIQLEAVSADAGTVSPS
jgi:F-type H+-transporting ATPase subunit epsilon